MLLVSHARFSPEVRDRLESVKSGKQTLTPSFLVLSCSQSTFPTVIVCFHAQPYWVLGAVVPSSIFLHNTANKSYATKTQSGAFRFVAYFLHCMGRKSFAGRQHKMHDQAKRFDYLNEAVGHSLHMT